MEPEGLRVQGRRVRVPLEHFHPGWWSLSRYALPHGPEDGWKPLREDADRLTELCLDALTRGLEWEQPLYEASPKAQTLDAVLTALANSGRLSGKRALSSDYKAYRDARRPDEQDSDVSKASQDEFLAYLPEHRYIYRPTGDLWPPPSVDSALWPGASKHLDQNAAIQQMTWAPGMPEVIEDRLVVDGGWIDALGKRTYNLYKPPLPFHGDAEEAGPWVEHVRRVYPDDAEHIMYWLAQRVQSPEVKLNHALVLGGSQGIGKDTLLEPAIHGVGPWNSSEIAPTQLIGRFNGWVKSVILRVSEARDLGEINRFAFYDHIKTYIAAPPEVLRVDEKNRREYPVFNKTGVIITTNHKLDGLYLPIEDRRHYVAWSEATKEEFPEAYWKTLWDWYNDGGIGHVIAFLKGRDLSQFDPKAPPKQTEAFKAIVATNHPTDDLALADLLEEMGSPVLAVTSELASEARTREQFELNSSLVGQQNARKLPHRMERAGYELYANPDTKDGRWKVNNKNERIFARRGTTGEEREGALRQRRERVSLGEVGRPSRERPGLPKAA